MSTTTVLAQPKWIGKSMSIWGALIALAATTYQVAGPIADAVGVTVPVTPQDIQAAGNAGAAVISAIGAIAGLGLTVWGRFRAGRNVQPVAMLPNEPPKTVTVTKPPHSGDKTG